MSVHERLRALSIRLPEATLPAAAYVPFVRSGRQVFVSGHIARQDGKPWRGQLGSDMTTEQGEAAAQIPLGACVEIELIAELAQESP